MEENALAYVTPDQIEEGFALTEPASALQALKGKAIKVLDRGHVRLVDWMGSDDAIVQAARVSYGKGTKEVSEDRSLIRYLMRMKHTSPFEMCEFKFHIKVPMDAWRQWIRHRTASVNEYSTRYSEAKDEQYQIHPDEFRKQSLTNKQGSGAYLQHDEWPDGYESLAATEGTKAGWHLAQLERDLHSGAQRVYKEMLTFGVAKEQARKNLPLCTYTEAYWKIDLHNLFHFLSLRLDSHAQYEIRVFAQAIAEFVKRIVPHAWEAFVDYDQRQRGLLLSGADVHIIDIINTDTTKLSDLTDELVKVGFYNKKKNSLTREGNDFINKIDRLGIFYEPIKPSKS